MCINIWIEDFYIEKLQFLLLTQVNGLPFPFKLKAINRTKNFLLDYELNTIPFGLCLEFSVKIKFSVQS